MILEIFSDNSIMYILIVVNGVIAVAVNHSKQCLIKGRLAGGSGKPSLDSRVRAALPCNRAEVATSEGQIFSGGGRAHVRDGRSGGHVLSEGRNLMCEEVVSIFNGPCRSWRAIFE